MYMIAHAKPQCATYTGQEANIYFSHSVIIPCNSCKESDHVTGGTVPGRHGNHLVGVEQHVSLRAAGILGEDSVHDAEELLDTLVLSQVLPALHQEGVLPLVIAPNDQPLGLPDGGHNLHLMHDISSLSISVILRIRCLLGLMYT